MTYKEEDYGLQSDDICKKGYKYQIFTCNDHAAKTYLDKILPSILAKVVDLLDTVD